MTNRKPNETEEEYFKRSDEIKKKDLRAKLDRERHAAKRKQEKELHWMKCPKCGTTLVELPLRGVMVDKCSSCHGIWLDKGELELLAGEESSFLASFRNLFPK